LLYKKHPELYDRFIRPDRPLLYYAILAALGTAVSGVVLDSSPVTLAGIGTWLGLTAMLIARRLHETSRRAAHVIEVIVTSIVVPPLAVYHRIRGGITFRVAFW